MALAFRVRLLPRGADDVGIKKMSDANEEKEPNNAKRGREEEKAVPIQQDVKICNHRTPPKAKSLSRNTFSTSSS